MTRNEQPVTEPKEGDAGDNDFHRIKTKQNPANHLVATEFNPSAIAAIHGIAE